MRVTEFITNLPDIPRIITALAEWLACLVCVFSMKRRNWAVKWRFAAVSTVFLAVQSIFLVVTDGFDGVVWNLCMMAAILFMFCYIRICTKATLPHAICICCIAFIASEFAASIEWQIWCYVHDVFGLHKILWQILFLLVIYGIIFSVILQLCKSIYVTDESFTVTYREMAMTVMATFLIFAVSNLGFLPVAVPFAGRDSMEIFNMRTLVDLGGLAILYAYQSQWKSSYTQRELEVIQAILNSQYEQYKQAERTVDLINYRYHDLKNHIIALRSEGGTSRQEEYLDKLEHEIQNYEALNKTGNQVLDTLLTSKNLRCMQHKINMTCVIDGKLFDSMDVMDICSIFGNALDNAIEYELKIKDYDKRMIHVDAFSEKSFLIIRFENFFEGHIEFSNGLPLTTKSDTAMHGYGLKSLRYTVHKYKGEVQIGIQDSWFSLRVLIPAR